MFNKRTGRSFIGKRPGVKSYEEFLVLQLRATALRCGLLEPITSFVWCMFWYYLPSGRYWNKDGSLSKKLPDFLNLHCAPADCLQQAGVIKNDNLVRSTDYSEIFPSYGNVPELEIWIMPYRRLVLKNETDDRAGDSRKDPPAVGRGSSRG